MGARFRRLLRATPRACTRSRSGSVAPPGSELALDRDIHPALDRLSDREREVSPTAEACRDLIGEVPAVPAIEEVADGLIAATRALRDPGYSKRPRLIRLGVLLNSAVEAAGFVLACNGRGCPVSHLRSPGSVTACTLF